jgi:hypothetical protein
VEIIMTGEKGRISMENTMVQAGLEGVTNRKLGLPTDILKALPYLQNMSRQFSASLNSSIYSQMQMYIESVSKSFRTDRWSENCKWYSSPPLCAVIVLFCESV